MEIVREGIEKRASKRIASVPEREGEHGRGPIDRCPTSVMLKGALVSSARSILTYSKNLRKRALLSVPAAAKSNTMDAVNTNHKVIIVGGGPAGTFSLFCVLYDASFCDDKAQRCGLSSFHLVLARSIQPGEHRQR